MSEHEATVNAGCPRCLEYHLKLERIREIINLGADLVPRGRREFAAPVGKLIAATASAKGKELSTISLEAGFADDYVARVCRGNLALNARAAKLIGDVLGVDLGEYVVATKRAPRKTKSEPASPDLPGVAVPVAPGVSLTMGGGGERVA